MTIIIVVVEESLFSILYILYNCSNCYISIKKKKINFDYLLNTCVIRIKWDTHY